MQAETAEISVVVPVYDCDSCLHALHERLTRTLSELVDEWELIFVDDRSRDGSWATLLELAAADERVKAIRLSRNFGQHAAITAGITESTGRWTVVMDCDLQDPPEAIADLYAEALRGHDIVVGRRRTRRQTVLRRFANRVYFRVRNALVGLDLETEHSNLSMISAKVRESYLSIHDKHRNFLLILYWLGFDRSSIEFEHADRHSGRSSYTLGSLLRVGLDGLFFHTTAILRWIVYVGFAIAALSIVLALYFLAAYFARVTYPGWTSLAVLVLLIGGFIIIAVSVTGLYLGKVFEQVKDRPLYLVDQRVAGAEAEQRELEVEPRLAPREPA